MKWNTVKLGEVCQIVRGSSPRPKGDPRYFGGDIPWIKISDVTKADGKMLTETTETVTEEGAKRSRIVNPGELIVTNSATIGVPIFLGIRGCIHDGFLAFLDVRPDVSLAWLYWFFRSVRESLKHKATTGTQLNLTTDIVRSLDIPLPPLAEQRRLALILDRADEVRRLRVGVLERLDELVASLFVEMFGDPATNPKNWPMVKLGEVVQIKAGPFGSALKKEFYRPCGYRIYGQEQVIAGDFSVGDYYIDAEKFNAMKAYKVEPGDVLMSLVGTIGKVVVVPGGIESGIINPRLLKLSPRQQVASVFLAHLLMQKTTQHRLAEVSHGGTMPVLNAGLLKQHVFPLPSLSLQNQFAARVEAIESLRVRAREALVESGALFASLQDRAFRGEL